MRVHDVMTLTVEYFKSNTIVGLWQSLRSVTCKDVAIFLTSYCFLSNIVLHGSLSALIENKIFSVHGGLSPSITTLDQVSNTYPCYLCV